MISFTDKMVNGKIARRDPVRLDGKPDKSVFERIGRQVQDPLMSEDAVRKEILKPKAEDAWQLSGVAMRALRGERDQNRVLTALSTLSKKSLRKSTLMPRLRMRMPWW